MTWYETLTDFSMPVNELEQSTDGHVCLVYAGEIRPVLAIEIDGYGGRIDSDFALRRHTFRREWASLNKHALFRNAFLGWSVWFSTTVQVLSEHRFDCDIASLT